MNSRRDRSNRTALFDGIEEGGIRANYSHEIDEHENDRAIDGLQDRVNLLKRLSGDINEEVESHNHMLDRMGNDMDASRGILSGTMDRFKMCALCLPQQASCYRRSLRRNQAGECSHLWQFLWCSS
ncbi:hypothetical protein Syun_016285 [Stephania yunnanensis]|uniref:t-SNARE coiled-coil homology domain-containing protein n=1 Tax=Stephania yunnanensis TaxID=152371 RepID=A0AAP0J6X6_9MAGN